jgi:alanine racemase
MNTSADRCWAEIDRSALRHNAKVVRERIGSAELLAVVKANGYGHGMVGVAPTLAEASQLFGVANLAEATELRAALLHPIIILGPALPEERATIAERGFIPSISTFEEAQDFDRVASGAQVAINFKVDTGMGRMGAPEGEALDIFKKVSGLAHIKIHSVSTHLPVSNEDPQYTRDELLRFSKVVKEFRTAAPGDFKAHALPSAGLLAFADPLFDIVRAGIMLYGISPLPEFQKLFKPAMTWKTRIALVRDMPKGSSISYGRTFITPRKMRIATLSAGYADGYPWHLSNRDAAVLVRGQRCALLGRVTMDLMMIDLSKIEGAQAGDEAVLMGRDGNEEVSAAELAERAGIITWELTTRIGSRVKRFFV